MKAITTVGTVGKSPSFREARWANDAGMAPDKGFTKQLHALDDELDVLWNWAANKWEIWRFPKEGEKQPFHMMTVQTKDKSYRELGADILVKLQASDPTRYSLNELVAYFDKMDDNIMRHKRKALDDKISSITNDIQQTMRGVLQVQVPKRFAGGHLIDIPKEQKVRRAICNA